jgi:hypothetical protein
MPCHNTGHHCIDHIDHRLPAPQNAWHEPSHHRTDQGITLDALPQEKPRHHYIVPAHISSCHPKMHFGVITYAMLYITTTTQTTVVPAMLCISTSFQHLATPRHPRMLCCSTRQDIIESFQRVIDPPHQNGHKTRHHYNVSAHRKTSSSQNAIPQDRSTHHQIIPM